MLLKNYYKKQCYKKITDPSLDAWRFQVPFQGHSKYNFFSFIFVKIPKKFATQIYTEDNSLLNEKHS